MIIDACNSGFMTKRGDLVKDREYGELMTRRSRSVVAASTEDQPAADAVFTKALLRHLPVAEALSLSEHFLKVRKDVVDESKGVMLPQRGTSRGKTGSSCSCPLPSHPMTCGPP